MIKKMNLILKENNVYINNQINTLELEEQDNEVDLFMGLNSITIREDLNKLFLSSIDIYTYFTYIQESQIIEDHTEVS